MAALSEDPGSPPAESPAAVPPAEGGDGGWLRAAWTALGGLLLAFGAVEAPGIMPGSVGPVAVGAWLAGAVLLARRRRAASIAAAWRGVVALRRGRVGIAVLVVLAVVLADLLGVYGMLAVATMGCAWGLALAMFVGTERTASAVATAALLAVSVGVALGAGEALVRQPAMARRLGTPQERAAREASYDRLWERNAFGYRSRFEGFAKPPGTLRVLALGDSFTWGDGIADSGATWPAVLERQLDSLLAGDAVGDVEVINLGRNGFTTANEAELLRRVGWQFGPDAVIVQFFRNDVLPSGPDFARATSSYVSPPHALVPASLRRGRLESSALLYALEGWYSLWRNRSDTDPWHRLYRDDFVGWQQLAGALTEMGEAAGARGVPIYLVIYPAFVPGTWTAATHPDREVHERVARVAASAGMRVVDLTSTFGDGVTDGRAWWAAPYDSHPNAAANEIAGRVIADVLHSDLSGCSRCGGAEAF